MICEHCNKEKATVFMTQILNGKKIELHLCSTCAKEHEHHIYNNNPSFQQFLSGLMQLSGPLEVDQKTSINVCPKCKMTIDIFKKHSKLGCDECYVVFKPYVKNILKTVHGGYKHTGKQPIRMNQSELLKDQIEELESKLRVALMQERYEEAAVLRDEINRLKEENI